MDTTVPGIHFDSEGVCNFCHTHDKMDAEYPIQKEGRKILLNLSQKIKKSSTKNKYDCIIGISGGRDSIYTLYYVVTVLKLNPLAIYFNDGFSNPIAGENMEKACKILNVSFEKIDADWNESKDIKKAFLRASTPDMGVSTDIGIAAALYSVAAREGLKFIIIGQSFRTEGIAPLSWYFMDGKYVRSVHKRHGSIPLKPWKATEPGFHLDIPQIFYYSILKGIRTIPVLYYVNYIRSEATETIKKEVGWVNPGAHYFDDLYQSLIAHVLRVKFNLNRNIFNDSALVRSGQMSREKAIERSKQTIQKIEKFSAIETCLHKLEISPEEFEAILKLPLKNFRDYPNNYFLIRLCKWPIYIFCKLNVIPPSAYDKYFNCGK